MICKLSSFVIVAQAIIVITANRKADDITPQRDKDAEKLRNFSGVSRIIEKEVGSDIQMNCTISAEHLPYNKNSLVVWYFQPCTSIFCDNSYNYLDVSNETEWIKLNHSSPILYLQDLDVDRDSGLYKCSVIPYRIKDLTFQFVMNHHLIVIDSKQTIPHILDRTPANLTTTVGQTAIFHCRVRSPSGFPPTIKWYKRHENDSIHPLKQKRTRSITYLNITYDLIKEGDQKQLADDLYLSKLILPGVKIHDSGIYGCVALSFGGFEQQEAYLKVNYPLGDAVKYSNAANEFRSFFWLFFFPICLFIIIPCIIWMWFHTYKKQCKIETCLKEKRLELNAGSNRWIARPSNAKNPYVVVNLDVV